MPAALKVDWEYAKLLRLQGLPIEDIAATLGVKKCTIASKASREKWDQQIAKAKQEVATVVKSEVAKGITKRAEQWTEAIMGTVESQAEAITKLPTPRSLRGLGEMETVLAQHIKNGRSMFGLDSQASAPAVAVGLNINIVQSTDHQPVTEVHVKSADDSVLSAQSTQDVDSQRSSGE